MLLGMYSSLCLSPLDNVIHFSPVHHSPGYFPAPERLCKRPFTYLKMLDTKGQCFDQKKVIHFVITCWHFLFYYYNMRQLFVLRKTTIFLLFMPT